MASVLDRYGIKEVADVTFYKIDPNGHPTVPVLYLDTLKVSTIEQTADETTANGGKGNVALISWDYNKDINVTIEDALFSAKSMAIMFGNGEVDPYNEQFIMKTEVFEATGTSATNAIDATAAQQLGWNPKYEGPDGKQYTKINPKFFTADNKTLSETDEKCFKKGEKYFCSFDLFVSGSVIRIGADTFPGTYYVVGDTWARPESGADDEFFQFIIPKAKVLSENTITLEADGDPSVFNFNLHVLRPESGDMMQLVKYNLENGEEKTGETASVYHNHVLQPVNSDAEATNDLNAAKTTKENNAVAAADESVIVTLPLIVLGDDNKGYTLVYDGANVIDTMTVLYKPEWLNIAQDDSTHEITLSIATGVDLDEHKIGDFAISTENNKFVGTVVAADGFAAQGG